MKKKKELEALADVDAWKQGKSVREIIDRLKETNAEYGKLKMEVEDLRGKVDRVTPAVMKRIEKAFWRVFHRRGKIFFSPLEDAEEVTKREFDKLRVAIGSDFD